MRHDVHPPALWLERLTARLDELERALLSTDAAAVQAASQAVHELMTKVPSTRHWAELGEGHFGTVQRCAQRFTGLRQAVLRLAAQAERATHVLLPESGQSPTYSGRHQAGGKLPGRAYLSA
jgi:hypothetical protein